MAVVTVDPGLLSTDPTALGVALADMVDGPTLMRIEGGWLHASPGGRAALAALPALTLGVGAPPAALDDALDLVSPDAPAADAVVGAFARAPLAAVSAALLLRQPTASVAAGLVAESTTYSMLQAGPEFQEWRAVHDRSPVAASDAQRVRVDEHDGVTEIVLVRSARHNALDVAMRDELHTALTAALWHAGPVVVRGEGPSFCSGGDLDEFATFPDPVHAHLVRLTRSLAASFAVLADRLVVALHGACLGAGIELPAFAAHVVAADDARIGLPEQALGLVPGAGGTVSITRRAGRRATLSLLLRDGTISAAEARDWGLVDHLVPPADLRARALEIAESLA